MSHGSDIWLVAPTDKILQHEYYPPTNICMAQFTFLISPSYLSLRLTKDLLILCAIFHSSLLYIYLPSF
jgi:hypothetical protein